MIIGLLIPRIKRLQTPRPHKFHSVICNKDFLQLRRRLEVNPNDLASGTLDWVYSRVISNHFWRFPVPVQNFLFAKVLCTLGLCEPHHITDVLSVWRTAIAMGGVCQVRHGHSQIPPKVQCRKWNLNQWNCFLLECHQESCWPWCRA